MRKLDISTPKHPNYFTWIDDEDFDRVNDYGKWAYDSGYVRITKQINGKKTTVKLHRYILGVEGRYNDVHHKDHNTLNNQKSNLVVCNRLQNAQNRSKSKNKSSRYKGVSRRSNGKWRARIRVNYQGINLGTFNTEREAALAYNQAAIKYHKQFALLNQVE